LTDSPLYLAPVSENPVLGMAERWRALPPAVTIDSAADVSMTLRGILAGAWTPRDRAGFDYGRIEPLAEGAAIDRFGGSVAGMVASRIPGRLGEPIREDRLRALQASGVYAYRSAAPMRVRASLVAQGGAELSQEVVFVSRHPLRIVPQTAAGDRLPIRIDNPTGAAFTGRVRLTGDPRAAASRPLEFAIGETARTVALPVVVRPDGSYSAGVQLVTRYGGQQDWTVVSEAPKVEYRPLEQFADYPVNAPLPPADYLVKPDGDPKVESTITASIVPAADAAQGDDAPANGPRGSAVRIEYDFAPGWKFLRLEPEGAKRAPLPGAPYALGAWVRGDGSGDILNARFTDSSGQTFQPTAGPIDWRGWRYVSFSLRGDNSGHWGGADDGVIHYPIHMDTLLLVDSPGRRGGKGTVYAGGFTLLSAP
ncbi:MAG TPA: hypothetical protein VKT77_01700, partial [Chthonomonadaceae bacterium]|nr:hypothetical protein [Chthonomonadaceae bacterium]